MSDRIRSAAEIIEDEKARNPDFARYLEMCPEDPYGNFYVRGWEDGSAEPGDWIMSHCR